MRDQWIFAFSAFERLFTGDLIRKRLFDSSHKLIICFKRRKLRVILLNLLGAFEQEARLARLYHAEIVVAVAACDGIVAYGLKRLDGGELGVFYPHSEARYLAVLGNLK